MAQFICFKSFFIIIFDFPLRRGINRNYLLLSEGLPVLLLQLLQCSGGQQVNMVHMVSIVNVVYMVMAKRQQINTVNMVNTAKTIKIGHVQRLGLAWRGVV